MPAHWWDRRPSCRYRRSRALSAAVGDPHAGGAGYDRAVKLIGTIVVVLLVGMGVATYFVTRPPDRELDAQGRAWVDRYEVWADKTERQVGRAIAGMDFTTEEKNARLIEPLRPCSASFARIGEPPGFLEPVREFVLVACSEAEFAVQVNDRDGTANLATSNVHLREAEGNLLLSRQKLASELDR